MFSYTTGSYSYRKCSVRAKALGNLSLPVDVDGHSSSQSLVLDLLVIQETGDVAGFNQNLQLVPASIEKSLQDTSDTEELVCVNLRYIEKINKH